MFVPFGVESEQSKFGKLLDGRRYVGYQNLICHFVRHYRSGVMGFDETKGN